MTSQAHFWTCEHLLDWRARSPQLPRHSVTSSVQVLAFVGHNVIFDWQVPVRHLSINDNLPVTSTCSMTSQMRAPCQTPPIPGNQAGARETWLTSECWLMLWSLKCPVWNARRQTGFLALVAQEGMRNGSHHKQMFLASISHAQTATLPLITAWNASKKGETLKFCPVLLQCLYHPQDTQDETFSRELHFYPRTPLSLYSRLEMYETKYIEFLTVTLFDFPLIGYEVYPRLCMELESYWILALF